MNKTETTIELTNLQDKSQTELINLIIFLIEENQTLKAEIEILKNQSGKDSSNSSKPPSTDFYKKPIEKEKSGKKPGGQIGRIGITRQRSENPDKVIQLKPENCNHCHKSIFHLEGKTVKTRQEIDIPPISSIITEYRQQEIQCPYCLQPNKGTFPDHITAPVQLGPNLKTQIVYLNIKHKLPYGRIEMIFKDMLDIEISQGSIENILEQCKFKSQKLYQEILPLVKKEKWVGGDETGMHVNGKKWWQWVWQNLVGSFYVASPSRGGPVVEKHFGKDYQGSLIHDCWNAQNNTVAESGHQLCHAHLIRELNYLIETYKSVWCFDLKRLLLKSQKAQTAIYADDFPLETRDTVIKDYQEKLNCFINQSLSEQKEIKAIQKRFRKHYDKIFHFLSDKDIPFHNNSSEQAIRNSKIHQKVSGGFRSENGAIRHAMLLSVVETCRKRGLPVFGSLRGIFQGTFVW